MWNRIHDQLHTNKVVAAAFPNDSDGNAFRAVFPPIAKAAGYTLDLSSAYPDGTTNYSSMISQFKAGEADFFTNVPLPPDFATMWKQSAAAGLQAEARDRGQGAAVPDRRLRAGLPGLQHRHRHLVGAEPAVDLVVHRARPASSWPTTTSPPATGQSNANISNYSLFEIAYAALTSVNDPHDKTEVADAIHKVNLHGGGRARSNFTSGEPAPGVAITPPVGIQWQKGTTYPLEAQGRRQHPAAATPRSPATCCRPTRDRMTTPLLELDQRDETVRPRRHRGKPVARRRRRGDGRDRGAERRWQDQPVRPHLRRPGPGRGRGPLRRAHHHQAGRGRPLPARHRADLPGAAAVRGHDRVRERARRRPAGRRAAAEGQLRGGGRGARADRDAGQANVPAERLGLLQRKRLELARALATRPTAAAARRGGRRPHRPRGHRARRDRPRRQRRGHRGDLDRARGPRAHLPGAPG